MLRRNDGSIARGIRVYTARLWKKRMEISRMMSFENS